ncbi:MAG: glycosyltransferase [Verrucomicrobiota bacterium]|nr:glycosyltransferase [Verrucomicrobiota bacterium]
MTGWEGLALTVLLAPVVITAGYALLAHRALESWLGERAETLPNQPAGPPITFFRPLKRGVPALRETLAQLVAALRTNDQLILGVDPGSEEEQVAEAVRAQFPERDVKVVPCLPGAALNPKVSKLLQMTAHAGREEWIVSDSEAWLAADFIDAFRREWERSGADVLTAAYRVVGLRTWPEQLDAAHVLLTFLPGLALVRQYGRVGFTLGACTALRRGDLARVGGWRAFGEDLAEDQRLGARLAALGRTIRLSERLVTLGSDRMNWADYWRHQRRVALTWRVSNPAGFAGLIVTHGVTASALLLCWAPTGPRGWWLILFLGIWGQRAALAGISARRHGFPLKGLPLAVLGVSLVETVCWLAAWLVPTVWWAGRWFRVSRTGKLVPRS